MSYSDPALRAGPAAPQPGSGLTVPLPLSRHTSVASTDGANSCFSTTSSMPFLRHPPNYQATSTTTLDRHHNNGAYSLNPPSTNPSPATPLLANPSPTNQPSVNQSPIPRSPARPLPVAPPPVLPPIASGGPINDHNTRLCEEWRSWKIHWLYLSLLLLVTILFIGGITAVTIISHVKSGFARESQPPGFLRDRPGLRKAIWEQGIFYTALPAFIMTIYRTMWDASVMSFADRQPYVDLLTTNGRAARRTILLDYKMEPILYRWILAFRNRHYVLSACMLTSLVLSFGVVPLTSFLFTMDSSDSNSTFALTVDTYFDPNIRAGIPGLDDMPDIRLVLDTASSFHLHSLGVPPNTDGVVAFPRFTTQDDLGSSTLALKIDAYGVESGCVEIPEGEYNKTVQTKGPNWISILVEARDRECAVFDQLDIGTSMWSQETYATSKFTSGCPVEDGWSRISVVAARYDRVTQTVQNFTFVSCKTSYFSTTGELAERSEPKLSPRLLFFNESQEGRRFQSPLDNLVTRTLLEKDIHSPRCVDRSGNTVGNEFVSKIYQMAQQVSPEAPLKAEALVNATATLYETVYAVYTSLYLFKRRDTPINGTGVYRVEEKRLFVVPAVAYIILGVLGIVAYLNIWLFFLAKQKSILREEPFSILSYAGLVHKSEDINILVRDTAAKDNDPRKARERAKKKYKLDDPDRTWRYKDGKIMVMGELRLR